MILTFKFIWEFFENKSGASYREFFQSPPFEGAYDHDFIFFVLLLLIIILIFG